MSIYLSRRLLPEHIARRVRSFAASCHRRVILGLMIVRCSPQVHIKRSAMFAFE